ncbi:MAG: FecR domain-containing protein [Chitinophagaceae bacterium]|nr:FecR domain-containing protein [Chitinophagaceae bacterium]
MDKSKFTDLIDNYVAGTLSKEGWKQLKDALDDPENLVYLDEELLLTFMNDAYLFNEPEAGRIAINSGVSEKIKMQHERNHLAQHPMVASKRIFVGSWRWAAAILFMLLSGTLWWLLNNKKQEIETVARQSIDLPPGKNGAILKLGDGSEVVLDSLADGIVATQPGTKVKLIKGQLVYDTDSKTRGEVVYNTMTTPRGRQFRLVLPDGTRVWLNAASSITYPAYFSGDSRTVKVSGEAYFEVARLENKPFKINVDDRGEVEVLGTHFNINAYKDEQNIKTTLLEGSVKASSLIASKVHEQIVLKPGQQAEITDSGKLQLNESVNTDQVMAWKNELFNFENASLQEVMRQLSRWYDIEVVYEKEIPQMTFGGEMSRNVSLSGLLSGLERAGVHFRIEEGNRLIVMP